MRIACRFSSVETEVASKNASMLRFCEDLESELRDLCALKLGEHNAAHVEKSIAFAKSLRVQDASYGKMKLYLSHPIRVAEQVVEMQCEPDLETVLLGLLHNVFEVCGLNEHDLEKAGYSSYISRGVRLLTIRRDSEADPDYLVKFYGDIETYGERLSLIRCVDKLDNLLGLELLADGKVRTRYLDLAEQFVAPMASRLAPEFGTFFREVISYMRSKGCNPVLLDQYHRFVRDQKPV